MAPTVVSLATVRHCNLKAAVLLTDNELLLCCRAAPHAVLLSLAVWKLPVHACDDIASLSLQPVIQPVLQTLTAILTGCRCRVWGVILVYVHQECLRSMLYVHISRCSKAAVHVLQQSTWVLTM